MSTIRDIAIAVSSASDGSAAVKYNKGGNSRGEGDLFEERVLALVFLRCLNRGMIFQLSANNADAGKFDDVVLVWWHEGLRKAHILCVQLKHRRSATVPSAALLSESTSCDFGLRKYCTSYAEVRQSLEGYTVTFVLMTNASLGASSLGLFERQEVGSDPGLQLLQAGGDLYRLNTNNQQVRQIVSEVTNHTVWEEVQRNTNFTQHFYLLWKQKDYHQIDSYIYNELQQLLGAGEVSEFICDRLCKRIRKWMNSRKAVCLTRSWDQWQALVDDYIKKEVTKCTGLTTRLEYCSVEAVWNYMESHNPAWVTPPERGTEALSATKIHQALVLDDQTHIMVTVEHFREATERILRSWGPDCRWLVVVDDNTKDFLQVLSDLREQRLLKAERRLIIVSSRENDTLENGSFIDTCWSSEVSDDTWNEFLNVGIRLNGENYRCCLRDLVTEVELQKLLDNQPSLLLALARLSQPLRMGQQLETLPQDYVPRKLVDPCVLTEEFFSTLGVRDVCIIDTVSYELLKRDIGKHSVMRLKDIRSFFRSTVQVEWPLVVLTDNLETIREECICLKGFNIYLLERTVERWRILSLSIEPDRNRSYKREGEIEQLKALDTARNVVIVEGRPGVGKSMMLSHMAEQVKERDSTSWLLRVNLSEFYRVLHNSDSGLTAVENILKATIFNKDQLGTLEYELLRHSLMESTQLVCLVDGFDDVCPDYIEKCFEMLSLLARGKGKLVVTTNPAVVRLLEARMGVLAHTLRPFSKSELEDFFNHHSFALNIPSINRLNIGVRSILRLPLFAKMFVKLSQEKAETHDIVNLYETFFQNIFRRFYEEKWGDNFSAPGKKREVEEAQKQHGEQLMLLAAPVLLRSKPTLDTEYFVKYGIVYNFDNGKPVFLHWSFAEHFLAKWCFLRAGGKTSTLVYRKAYREKRLKFFLESFDRRAVKGHPLLEAVISGNKGEVKALLARGANPRETDACGRNALHLAAASCMQHSPSLLRLLCRVANWVALSSEDSLLGWTPIRYAAEGRSWPAVNAMLELGGDIGQLGDFPVRRQDPHLLQTEFERGGYSALCQYFLWVNHPSLKTKAPWQDVCIQIQFAVSLLCTNMPRKWLRAVADRAEKEGHHAVSSIILCKLTRREENVNSFCGRKN